MNYKAIALFFLLNTFTIFAMQPPIPAPASAPTPSNTGGWLSWVPFHSQTEKAVTQGIKVNHDLHETNSAILEASKNFKTAVDHNSDMIDELQKNGFKISNQTIKTCLIAGIGTALAVSGLIILVHKWLYGSPSSTRNQENLPLYKRIATNRYAISGALFTAGLALILKSDAIVKATN